MEWGKPCPIYLGECREAIIIPGGYYASSIAYFFRFVESEAGR
jgi:hypothetical protein